MGKRVLAIALFGIVVVSLAALDFNLYQTQNMPLAASKVILIG